MIDFSVVRKKYKAFVPSELIHSKYTGDVYGFHHQSTGVFNITGASSTNGEPVIGHFYESQNELRKDALCGYWDEERLVITYEDEFYDVAEYTLEKNLFSRNTGILETDWMMDKTAFLLGCGSVGSLVALELARAGVGTFVLIDNDIVEYHNLCRHQCGVHEVGSFKVDAMKKRILDINPHANVVTCTKIVEEVPKEIFDKYANKNSVFVGCADNREADIYGNRISMMYGAAYVSAGFWERAFAGEIFYHLPEQSMPCYKCALGGGQSLSARTSHSRRIYTTEENLENVNFEPGIAVDIDFVTVIAAKLAIDILNRFNDKYIPKLLPYFKQFTLICNTNDTRIGGDMAEIFAYPLQVTRNLKVDFREGVCPPCQYL